ncbi:ACT domain-containing protein [Paraburkholderia oxyphila]|uniref:hypothetical protein n=1 Tax=Paraburkholderia oxyphila TaxID=614212 RepID=UPI00047F51E6|nr:hypothetical protein [Paraburkholderia oxyphila]
MELDGQRIEVWEANIADQPEWLAHALDALDDAAAAHAGFHIPEHIHAIRVCGHNRTGLVAGLPGMIAGLGINLHGFTASTIGHEFVAYIAADSQSDIDRIVQALRQL